jgi:hypothetical protein
MNILMEKKKSEGIKGQARVGKGLLTNHFEKIVLEKACELETRVSKPLERNSVSRLKQYLPS